MIKVSNGYIARGDCGHYIGSAGKGNKGSDLANPFRLESTSNAEERDRVIAKYRTWLWQKIQAKDPAVMGELFFLKEQALTNDVNLLCFCTAILIMEIQLVLGGRYKSKPVSMKVSR